MRDAILHSRKSDGPEKENDQDDVRVDSGHVDHDGVFGDALNDAQVHQDPGGEQTRRDGEVEVFRGLDGVGDVQRFAIPKILRGTAHLNSIKA